MKREEMSARAKTNLYASCTAASPTPQTFTAPFGVAFGIILAKGERRGMALPLNIDDLILQRKVEGARIEYKKDWNPEKVLHSVCAFANDIDNWGGGYIAIAV